MSARGYHAAKSRPSCAWCVRDCELIPVMMGIHQDNDSVYRVRKIWHAMKRAGQDIGHDQVARLMREADLKGVIRGGKPITTEPAKTADVRPDLVQRHFRAPGPNRLWVADITYVRTRSGFVYTVFVTDVYTRKIVGWATQTRLTTEALPLQALNLAIETVKGSLKSWCTTVITAPNASPLPTMSAYAKQELKSPPPAWEIPTTTP